MAFLADFKKFAFRGNVLDLAVGVVIGGAFGRVVTATVEDIVMPMVSLVMPNGNWRNGGWILRRSANASENIVLSYGHLLGAVVDFLIIAMVLFVLVSRVVRAAEDKLLGGHEDPAVPVSKKCDFCQEKVSLQATRCAHCTSQLTASA